MLSILELQGINKLELNLSWKNISHVTQVLIKFC